MMSEQIVSEFILIAPEDAEMERKYPLIKPVARSSSVVFAV
jgi:hypothetical protein